MREQARINRADYAIESLAYCQTNKVKLFPPISNPSTADSRRCSGLIMVLMSFSAIHETLPRSHRPRTSYNLQMAVIMAV
jgi:hypothetical protein